MSAMSEAEEEPGGGDEDDEEECDGGGDEHGTGDRRNFHNGAVSDRPATRSVALAVHATRNRIRNILLLILPRGGNTLPSSVARERMRRVLIRDLFSALRDAVPGLAERGICADREILVGVSLFSRRSACALPAPSTLLLVVLFGGGGVSRIF